MMGKNKIEEYKKRRKARILSRMDADEDGGRWVTTENDNHVHLNKNGVPDKGNPYVVAAMTGKKPKLSMNYHQKNVSKAIETGDHKKVNEELEKIPDGSKLLLNGAKYKANFYNGYHGRGVEFINEEDPDDILESYEVADELIENGDVSLERPERNERDLEENIEELPDELAYEPDIEPEEENIEDIFEEMWGFEPSSGQEENDPNNPEELPYDLPGYSEESPQEMSDNTPDDTAPQEVSASSGITKQSFVDKINEIKENVESETGLYTTQDAKPIADMLNEAPVGSVLKTEKMGWNCTKQADGKWIDVDVGEVLPSSLSTEIMECGIASFEVGEENPESQVPQSVGAVTKTGDFQKDFESAIKSVQDKDPSNNGYYSVDDVKEVADVLESAPVGTSFKLKDGLFMFTKTKDGWKEIDDDPSDEAWNAYSVAKLSVKNPVSDVSKGEGEANTENQAANKKNSLSDLYDVFGNIAAEDPQGKYGNYSDEQVQPIVDILHNPDIGIGSKITLEDGQVYTKKANGWADSDGYVESSKTIAKTIMANGLENFSEANTSTPSWSPAKQKAQDEINKYIKDLKDPNAWASISQLGQSLNGLEDGSTIQIGNKKYIKGTDDFGDSEFKNPEDEHDWYSATGIGNAISIELSKAKSKGQADDFSVSIGGSEGSASTSGTSSSGGGNSQTNNKSSGSYNPPKAKKSDIKEFSENDYSQDRKDLAVWDTTGGKEYDDVMRSVTGAVWKQLSEDSKDALHAYTTESGYGNYKQINTYLRNPDHGGQSAGTQEDMEKRINLMTEAISQSEAPTDMWVQRGTALKNLRKLFNVTSWDFDEAAKEGPDAVLNLLQSGGDFGMDNGFMSCGSAKGQGFSDENVILNIYCPKGTQMLYSEPFAALGMGSGRSWDGERDQYSFSSEDETILQRGTMLRPTKVTKSQWGNKWYVDVEVIGQEYEEV